MAQPNVPRLVQSLTVVTEELGRLSNLPAIDQTHPILLAIGRLDTKLEEFRREMNGRFNAIENHITVQ